MNNYYTLIYLIREWKETLIGSTFDVALSTRRNLLELFFEKDNPIRLIFSSNPQHAALFTDRYQAPRRHNTTTVFDVLCGDSVTEVKLAESDRFVELVFESGKKLVFLLYSNHANSILIDEGTVMEAFKRDRTLAGQSAPEPAPVVQQKQTEILKINDLIACYDPLLPRNAVRYVLRNLDLRENQNVAVSKLQAIQHSLSNQAFPHFSDELGFSIVDPEILGVGLVKHFDRVNEAVAYSFFKWVKFQDFDTKKKSVTDRIEKTISRTNVAISELSHGEDVDEKVDLLEKYGHLLMSTSTGTTESGFVRVNDYYQGGIDIQIKVDPQKSLVQNAQDYYQKSQSVRKAALTYSKRLQDFRQKLEQLNAMLKEVKEIKFGRDLEKWLNSNEHVLRRIGYSESDSIQTAQHFRSYPIGSYEVRVGKSAVSNDELLSISRKDDIWMHARGVSGSHVVIPLNKNQPLPPAPILEYAAGLAAFFSKAKGSSLVPVIFTRKKHVRKSKGMAPGAVFVDKEEVLLVPPVKPDEQITDD